MGGEFPSRLGKKKKKRKITIPAKGKSGNKKKNGG